MRAGIKTESIAAAWSCIRELHQTFKRASSRRGGLDSSSGWVLWNRSWVQWPEQPGAGPWLATEANGRLLKTQNVFVGDSCGSVESPLVDFLFARAYSSLFSLLGLASAHFPHLSTRFIEACKKKTKKNRTNT